MSMGDIAIALGFIVTALGAVLSFFAGAKVGQSSGRSEGAAQARSEQNETQSKEAAQAVKDRQNVETSVAADTDAELDVRLSKHNRSS